MDLMKLVEKEITSENSFPEFKAGDTITVNYKIKEGNKERIQQFRGVVIQRRGKGEDKALLTVVLKSLHIADEFFIGQCGANLLLVR